MTEAEKAAAATGRDRALTVPCPACGVPAGDRCISRITLLPSNLVHGARAEAWKATEQCG